MLNKKSSVNNIGLRDSSANTEVGGMTWKLLRSNDGGFGS